MKSSQTQIDKINTKIKMQQIKFFLFLFSLIQNISGFVFRNSHIHSHTHSHTQLYNNIHNKNHPTINKNFISISSPNKNNNDIKIFSKENNIHSDTDPLYIIIWRDCEDCEELLQNLSSKNIKHFYLNIDKADIYVYDSESFDGEDAEDHFKMLQHEKNTKTVWNHLSDFKEEIEVPLFYKNERYIGNTLMDIYSEIYPM